MNTRKDLLKTYPLHHRITEWWGYEGVSGDHQGQPPLLKQVHLAQSSIHLTVHSSHSRFLPLPYEEGMGDSVKSSSDVKVDDNYCSPQVSISLWATKTLFAVSSKKKAALRLCPLLHSFIKMNQINFTHLCYEEEIHHI